VDLWLALARLEEYQEARKVLNAARKKVPSEPQIWFTAAKLEEANQNPQNVPKILERAMRQFADMKLKVSDDRDFWQEQAANSEKEGYPVVCAGLIEVSADINLLQHERRRVWEAECESLVERSAYHCSRTLYQCLIKHYPTKKKIWMAAATLEKKHGTPEALNELLRKATTFCPKAWPLWLMGAKEKWISGDVTGARQILAEAFRSNPDNEEIYLAAVKLENDNCETDRARTLLEKARDNAGTARVWMKSALLERDAGDLDAAIKLLHEGVGKYAEFDKMWIMLLQCKEAQGKLDEARDAINQGSAKCPQSTPLWIQAAQLEHRNGQLVKARSMLEKARLKNPKNQLLWLESIRLENNSENKKLAATRLAQALQECPNSGLLWAEAILMEPRQQRKTKSVDAIKACENDCFVITVVARLFHQDRKLEKARTWFNRACTLNPDYGDAWAHWYRLEVQHGDDMTQGEVRRRCQDVNPRHGEIWQKVVKLPGTNLVDGQAKLIQVVKHIATTAAL